MKESSFLGRIAAELHSMPFESTLVVVPTRRAAAELRIMLAKQLVRPSILPTILGVSDFNDRAGTLPVVSKETLLLELFSVYRNHDPDESLTTFTGWGEQLLKDFNEIDLQLIFANDLFRKMADIREMEMEFSPSEDRDNFLQFWNEVSEKELSPLKQNFLSYWEILPFVYHDFRNHLLQKQFAYEGLSLRLSVENQELPAFLKQYTHFVYAGFYALNRVEERFLEMIGKQMSLHVYKDADNWYVHHPVCEAGMFFRKGFMSDPSIGWSDSYLENIPKEYNIIAVSGATAMAREIAARLFDQLKQNPDSARNTVVILPDENLLPGLLSFCQTMGVPVNPSMGFPISQHNLWQILETLMLIRSSFAKDEDPASGIRKRDLLFGNPLIKQIFHDADGKDLPPLLHRIIELPFKHPETESQLLLDLLYAVLPHLENNLAASGNHFIRETESVIATLLPYHQMIDPQSWWKLMSDALQPLRIPFTADREKGIHVMGFLETRVLDFQHVYIASMNEKKFPDTGVSTSLIPYVIRKYYGLPCREEQEAVTAYHFYRLLQRAGSLNLFHDENPDEMGGGEKSRFLLQLFYELIPAQKNAIANYFQVLNPPGPVSPAEISIVKSDEIIEILEKKYAQEKALSASAINTYIYCPLKFYFEQVAGIRSSDNKVDALEANIFGNVLHEAMKRLYKDQKIVNEEQIRELKSKVKNEVLAATSDKYRPGPLFGHDLLMQEVILKLVYQILENDLKETPFEIQSVEEEYKRDIVVGNRNIHLSGNIDRLDLNRDELRVLDYKTGQDEAKLPSKDISRLYSDPQYKTAFQLLFYLYLIQPVKAGRKVKAGIFRLSRENQFSFLDGDDESLFIKTDFENNLRRIILEIFDPSKPFLQTEDPRLCSYCDFAGLCSRN